MCWMLICHYETTVIHLDCVCCYTTFLWLSYFLKAVVLGEGGEYLCSLPDGFLPF